MSDANVSPQKDEKIHDEEHQDDPIEVEESIELDEPTADEEARMDLEKQEALQEIVALEVRAWLDEHGVKLYALEFSKKRVRDEKTELKKGFKPQDPANPKRKVPVESQLAEPEKKRRRVGSRPQS